MKRLAVTVCLVMFLTLCMAPACHAHKVNIFAYVDGDTIVTDSGYSRTKRVYDGMVEVYDAASGRLLLSGPTDTDGKFSFAIPAEAREGKMDLRLLLKAGSGHQADWVVKYGEYGEAAAASAPAAPAEESAASAPDGATATGPVMGGASAAEVQAIVRRELEPVKTMLAELSQPGPSVTEIVGGIGYILGLFGIAAYMKSRKTA